jgi:signal transduction histidine kinase
MNRHLKYILDTLLQIEAISDEQKSSINKSLKDADKELTVLEFKLDRTEKVKRTTAILLEETIEELELKRKAIEETNSALQRSLEELKSTQAQLIQQEKLASLGQLTAGIAHEIKNPLNFVNNFSEVSIEMIGEVIDSRLKTQDTRPKTEADEIEDEILEDIKANLEKIHEHGSRANSIVSSMLQHSRGGSGKKEPTDLNALIKEYVNLSFHGMRAGKNPINVEIVLDFDPEVKDVSLVKEDFTRVIINLCNNAFDAMRASLDLTGFKNLSGLEAYHPKLTVRTKSEKDRILISVEDNGPGIPDEIKDKILQPFFTTKKGTEGTGLGLSITHDIIKAHGGELKILTKVGEGTDFQILLPFNQTEK